MPLVFGGYIAIFEVKNSMIAMAGWMGLAICECRGRDCKKMKISRGFTRMNADKKEQ